MFQSSGDGVGQKPRSELVKVEKQLVSKQTLLDVYFPEMNFIGNTENDSLHVSLIAGKNIWARLFFFRGECDLE